MGLGFFVLDFKGHRYVYHDGDQGGFSSEMLIDPSEHTASILAVNTTDTGPPASSSTLHPQSNTEPEPGTDLRLTLRQELLDQVFPTYSAGRPGSGKKPSNSVLQRSAPTIAFAQPPQTGFWVAKAFKPDLSARSLAKDGWPTSR
jgi:hypothetical protein